MPGGEGGQRGDRDGSILLLRRNNWILLFCTFVLSVLTIVAFSYSLPNLGTDDFHDYRSQHLLPKPVSHVSSVGRLVVKMNHSTEEILPRETQRHVSKVSHDDKESMVVVNNNSTFAKEFNVYTCGYGIFFGDLPFNHAKSLFPDATNVSVLDTEALEKHTVDDIVISTVQGPCIIQAYDHHPLLPSVFNGTILYINGEPLAIPDDELLIEPRIAYTGHEPDSSKRLRVHMGAWYLTGLSLETQRTIYDPTQRPRNEGTKFLIYATTQCLPMRENAFARLSHIGKAYYGGRCTGGEHAVNVSAAPDMRDHNSWISNVVNFRPFRFALVMENTKLDGYITEKIINAFIAGSIPIWYGTLEVFDIFNKNAFVYYDPEEPEIAVEQVRYLESNQTAYDEMMKEPILANGEATIMKYFSLRDDVGSGMLKHLIRRMLNF